ncbi:hypothetical protein ABQF35_04875 [Mycobacterium syngnathidarum]
MYDAVEVLHHADEKVALTLVFGAIAFGSMFVWYYQAVRLAFRDRCTPWTPIALGFFIVHDGSYLLRFDDWFTIYDHWLLKGLWVVLIFTESLNIALLVAVFRFGREESAPHLSQQQWAVACIFGIVAWATGWGLIKSALEDPLFQISFLLTLTWLLPSYTSLLARRGTRRGLSVSMFLAYTGIAIGFALLSIVVFEFHSFWWIGTVAVTIAWGLWMLRAVSYAPTYTLGQQIHTNQ